VVAGFALHACRELAARVRVRDIARAKLHACAPVPRTSRSVSPQASSPRSETKNLSPGHDLLKQFDCLLIRRIPPTASWREEAIWLRSHFRDWRQRRKTLERHRLSSLRAQSCFLLSAPTKVSREGMSCAATARSRRGQAYRVAGRSAGTCRTSSRQTQPKPRWCSCAPTSRICGRHRKTRRQSVSVPYRQMNE